MNLNNKNLRMGMSTLALAVIFVLSRINNTNAELVIGIILIISSTLFLVYFSIKKIKFFIIFLILVDLISIMITVASYCKLNGINYNYLMVFFPILFILLMLVSYIGINKYGTREQKQRTKPKFIFIIVLLTAAQIFFIYLVFFRKR